MGTIEWIILSFIISCDVLLFIAGMVAAKRANKEQKRTLSRYTLDGLVKELNRNSNNPKIYWK